MAAFRKRGTGWQARVRRAGYPDEVKTFPTRVEAERWARSVEGEMDRGEFTDQREVTRTTLGDLVRRYMAEVTPSKRGAREEVIRLNAMLRNRLCELSLAHLAPQEVARYRDERLQVCGAATVIRDLAVLSAIVNHARREWGIRLQNPVALVRKPPAPPGRDRVLTEAEELLLLGELEPRGRRNPFMQSLVIVAIETAMRRGELLCLQWEHVDVARRVAYLPMTKNGRSRYVPLSSRAVRVIESTTSPQPGRVFPVSIAAMEAAFSRATHRAGLHGLHFHDLRHTATSRIARRLPNVIELASVTGHESLQMLKRYFHPEASEIALKLA